MCGRKEKGRFRQVRPFGESLHAAGCQSFSVNHNGEGIPAIRIFSEDINLDKSPFHENHSRSSM
jgi:hypothetical protein